MSELEEALLEVASVLETLSLPYMVVGGLAVSFWGVPRATLDVDVGVWVEADKFEETIQQICSRLRPLTTDPVTFARRTRVVPVATAGDVRTDLILGALPFEREQIERAVRRNVGHRAIPVACLEDLILMKLVSEREKDQADARELLQRNRESVDVPHLEPRLRELADGLARPEILKAFRNHLNPGS